MLRTLDDLDLEGKRILIRSDLNVPLSNGKVADTARILAAVDTIREVLERGGTPVVMSHLGRPDGRRREDLSLAVVVQPLSEALGGVPVRLAGDCIGAEARKAVDSAEGGVVLLQNLRFHAGEESNDPVFTVELSAAGDVFVNDAFSVSHRNHASVVGVAEHLPSVAGRLLQREITTLDGILGSSIRPALAVIAGTKVADKLPIIERLCERFDWIVVGGGVANTLLRARGCEIGRSVHQEAMLPVALKVKEQVAAQGSRLVEPVDVVAASDLAPGAAARTVNVDEVSAEEWIVDLGPRSIEQICEYVDKAALVTWAGPLGAAELGFGQSTAAVAQRIVERTEAQELRSVAAGGETLETLQAAGFADGFSYLSLGGGAFLKWLSGESLPGLRPLLKSP